MPSYIFLYMNIRCMITNSMDKISKNDGLCFHPYAKFVCLLETRTHSCTFFSCPLRLGRRRASSPLHVSTWFVGLGPSADGQFKGDGKAGDDVLDLFQVIFHVDSTNGN